MNSIKEYKATQKFLIMSPRKLRLVVDLIKKMKPLTAVERLPFSGKRAGFELAKVIKSAMANARMQGVSDNDLVFKEIQIGEGLRLKRGKAASRGRWHPLKKRMSHIRVVLTDKAGTEKRDVNKKQEKNNTETKKIETKNIKTKKGGKKE